VKREGNPKSTGRNACATKSKPKRAFRNIDAAQVRSRRFCLGSGRKSGKRKALTQRSQRKRTEFAEKKNQAKRREFLTLERKNPPLQTKGGAPSSSFELLRNKGLGAQAGVPVPQEAEPRAGRMPALQKKDEKFGAFSQDAWVAPVEPA